MTKKFEERKLNPVKVSLLFLRSTYVFFVKKFLKKIHDKQRDKVYDS